MNKEEEITNELKEIAPMLASLRDDMKVHEIDDAYIEELISKNKQGEVQMSKNSDNQVKWLMGIAASLLLIVGAFSIVNKPKTNQLNNTYVEAYVDDNLDEFEDYIIDELEEEDLVTESTVPKELIITYFEESLDELDIEFFYE